eukprot:243137_1
MDVVGSDVIRVYPEVHTAIKTKHAAHLLLNFQKKEIDELFHRGYLEDSEHDRFSSICESSLDTLFHVPYTDLSDYTDDSISSNEKKSVIERAKPSKWYKKGEYIMREYKNKNIICNNMW